MNWLIIFMVSWVTLLIVFLVGVILDAGPKFTMVMTIWSVLNTILFLSLAAVKGNIEDRYDWYIETRFKYAEAEGLEKERLRLDDVMTYNLWYSMNKEDLENPWNFKSATGCEFDYIKIGD